jgi:centromere protein C
VLECETLTLEDSKTGITLEDKGVRDEYGMEPISAIFSSPAKSPPKRSASQRQTGGTVTDSESMDLEST